MIGLDRVKVRYEAARKCLGLSAPEGSFDFMLNFEGNQGRKIALQDDGRVAIIAFASDRNSRIVEFEASSEEELMHYLVDRLARSCVVRDMMNDPESGIISPEKYLENFEALRARYCNMLSESGIVE